MLELGFPLAVSRFVDRLLPGQNWPLILLSTGALLVVYALNTGLMAVVPIGVTGADVACGRNGLRALPRCAGWTPHAIAGALRPVRDVVGRFRFDRLAISRNRMTEFFRFGFGVCRSIRFQFGLIFHVRAHGQVERGSPHRRRVGCALCERIKDASSGLAMSPDVGRCAAQSDDNRATE